MKKLLFILTIVLCVLLLSGCSADERQTGTTVDFSTAKIGVQTGTSHDASIAERLPGAERVYFNTVQDMILSVEQGKIDCYIEDEPFYISALWNGAGITRAEESFAQVENAFAFPKENADRTLVDSLNAFIRKSGQDGTIERLRAKWISAAEPEEHPDYTGLEGKNGTIRVASVAENLPMSYLKNDLFTGFEIELLTLFASENGYALEFETVPFESVIMGLAAGKYDMAAASLNVTEERKKSITFSETYASFDAVYVIKAPETAGQIRSHADLENAVIGIITGSSHDAVVAERFPNAKRLYFSSLADTTAALLQGKIDAYVEDRTLYATMCWDGQPVTLLGDPLVTTQAGLITPKNENGTALTAQLNEFIEEQRANGTLDTLKDKWVAETEPDEHPDYSVLTGENGTLKVAVGDSMRPVAYRKGDMFTGLDVELLTRFAAEYGYRLEMEGFSFEGIISAVVSGKYDVAASGLTITPERAKSVQFTVPYLETEGVVIIPATQADGGGTFMSELAESFEKTFVREDRWKLILEGIAVTMLISLCSAAGGSVLGFGLYMLTRAESRGVSAAARGIAKVYSRIIAGTPSVVVLMILYYVVFGSFRDISGIFVAIVGFSLTFGAFVYDNLTVSVNSVDIGQTEAAYALGYSRSRTFFRIILPQAMKIFLPAYSGEAVSLVKATSIVGYIAVNDLTKVGDIIRSNTYEAFFPLIATAVIYFILTWILALLLGQLQKNAEPKQRSADRILKGIVIR